MNISPLKVLIHVFIDLESKSFFFLLVLHRHSIYPDAISHTHQGLNALGANQKWFLFANFIALFTQVYKIQLKKLKQELSTNINVFSFLGREMIKVSGLDVYSGSYSFNRHLFGLNFDKSD